MAGFETYDQDLRAVLAGTSEAEMQRELAVFARSQRDEVIRSGRGSSRYDTFVNGRAGAPEDSVKLPGPIVYVFANWRLAIETALAEIVRRVPRKSGRYASSFVVVVNGREVSDFDAIDAGAEITILNSQPYTRKMETGANGPKGARHFDLASGAFNRRFSGAFRARVQFLNVSGGLRPNMPYILRFDGHSRRKDRKAGQPITYPALILRVV